jgi:hypothetical protein
MAGIFDELKQLLRDTGESEGLTVEARAKSNFPHNNFELGFRLAYEAAAGRKVCIPYPPRRPHYYGLTPFQVGLRMGWRKARQAGVLKP